MVKIDLRDLASRMKEDRYEIKDKIGEGGIGAVYRAFDRRLNREVAIKRVLPEGGFENQQDAVDHLLKEAKSLSSVQHPHIVTVYDAGVDDEGPYVVMELLHGRTLDEMVERGSLTLEDFREVALQSQEALIAAQDLDLVHRDLKPTNVMVTWSASGKFQLKLVDFGLAKFSAKPSLQTIDHGDAVFGSIHYMAPEQFERSPLDQRTDMYAMGCMYYFCLTGRPPFDGETGPEVMASHLQHRVTPLHELRADLPPWVSDWVMWHIEREMDKRPANARDSLKKFLMSDQQNPENPEEAKPDQPKRPKLVFPGADSPPATPVVPDSPDPGAAPPPAEVPTGTAPQPIEPPAGKKPSVHTTGQVTESSPPADPPATPPETPPEPPAAEQPESAPEPPAPATPPAPVSPPVPPSTAAVPPGAPANPPSAVPPASVTPPSATPGAAPGPPGTINLKQGTPASPPPATGATPPLGAPGPRSGPSTLISGRTDAQKSRGMGTAAKVTILAVLLVAVAFVAIVVVGKSAQNREIERSNALLEQVKDPEARDIPTAGSDTEILLRASTSLTETSKREAIYQRLLFAESSDGTDLDAMIAEFAANKPMTPDIRTKLFKVVQGRKGKSALPFLIDHARTAKPQTATAALQAAESIASVDDLAELLSIIQFSSHPQVRQDAKKVVASLAARSENPEKLGAALKRAYDSATDEEAKRIFIELLGSAGGEDAASVVQQALESKDAKARLAAVAALGSWADDTQFETLLDYIAEEENDTVRKRAFESAFQFLTLDRERDEFDEEDMWKMLAREAELETEKFRIVDGLARITEDWAFAVVEYFVADEDDDVSFRAEKALERMEDRRARIQPDAEDPEDSE